MARLRNRVIRKGRRRFCERDSMNYAGRCIVITPTAQQASYYFPSFDHALLFFHAICRGNINTPPSTCEGLFKVRLAK